MSKIGPKEAALAALRANPKLKIVNPKPIAKEVVPHNPASGADPVKGTLSVNDILNMHAGGHIPPRFDGKPQGTARKGKSRMKVPKRVRGPESSPAGKKQAVLYAPEGECGFCDARRAVSREGMRRLRAKPDHGNVTDAVK